MPRLNRLLRLSLAALLVAAWQAALLHPLKHVDAQGAFVHIPGGGASKAPGDKTARNPLCDAIAAVAACVSGAAPCGADAISVVEWVPQRESVALTGARSLAYRSQAPPPLL